MDTASRPGVDLEKELTCSICTEILFQPLTLLDCLHTFCGSCLSDWFGWQLTSAENNPDPPSGPRANIYTCPSCRSGVRDTRHNATVSTLLDMYLAANPDKARPDDEQGEMRQKYKPGDNLIPTPRSPDPTGPGDATLRNLEFRMLQQARDLSLREAGVDSTTPEGRSDAESSRDTRHRDARGRGRGDQERRRRPGDDRLLQADSPSSPDEPSPRHSRSRQHSPDSARTRQRHIEHQASIRSLISSSDVDSHDLEREIDDFARQIQEEGLLDGLDLENIDLARNDELSRKITDAYRRRQRDRSRLEPSRRGPGAATARSRDNSQSHSRPPPIDPNRSSASASARRRSNSANTPSNSNQLDDRPRPPVSGAHLEVRADPERRTRRRTSSGGRSSTDPVRPSTAETRPTPAPSSTDLAQRSRSSDPAARRPSLVDNRSTSMPVSNGAPQPPPGERLGDRGLPFSARAAAAQASPSLAVDSSSDTPRGGRSRRSQRPADVVITPSPLPSLGLLSSPTQYHRERSPRYQEPSISCSDCGKEHIEYELHYNCIKCHGGSWNICLRCYRTGKGCLHWYGFGYTALRKWERERSSTGNDRLEPPHVLAANRYVPPKFAPGGAEGRRTLTGENPARRLESGMFCARCLAWANDCYWRCEYCNRGDWGFCNNCVNQGHHCTHALLPLTHMAADSSAYSPPPSPRSPRPPLSATLLNGSNAVGVGNFKPLTFTTTCDTCQRAIPPLERRHHCYACVSTLVPNTLPGDYDMCTTCYVRLQREGRISAENGLDGWRRCLKGHRMVEIGFEADGGVQRRRVFSDLVGGRLLRMDALLVPPAGEAASTAGTLQRWWWDGPDGDRLERIVTDDVAAAAEASATSATDMFPPDGGVGHAAAVWYPWYPETGEENELLFPRGAEIRELKEVGEEWYFGTYMGDEGLFPAPCVRLLQ